MLRMLLKLCAFISLIGATICFIIDRAQILEQRPPIIGSLDQHLNNFPSFIEKTPLLSLPIWLWLATLALCLFGLSFRRKHKFYRPFY